ncbi:hypothetical protein SNE40_018150 [Patella caerulea]|uniref:Reverse transcriptase domain-containing protein n=1 Tax=Patella caerulea TaxID=87958 RepID=A0AAN8J7V3_PATCE
MNCKARTACPPTLDYKTEVARNSAQKADLLAKTFATASSNINLTPEFSKRKNDFDPEKEKFKPKGGELVGQSALNVPFSLREYVKVKSAKKDGAPGPDRVKYSMLKNLPDSATKVVTDLYNLSWWTIEIRRPWRTATVFRLSKIGKPPKATESYRPISLTSTLCKTLETLVNDRLKYCLESNQLLDKNQSGFCRGRSTYDHIARLQNAMMTSSRGGSYLCVIFVDLSKAFDLVWTEGLLYKLSLVGIHGNMYNCSKSFVSDRLIRVTIGNRLSKETG